MIVSTCFRCCLQTFRLPLICSSPLNSSVLSVFGQNHQNIRWKSDDRRILIQSMPLKDMGNQGEREVDIDMLNAP